MTMKFPYGEAVRISTKVPAEYLKLGEIASVCGLNEVMTLERSAELGVPIGTHVYLLEAPCGGSTEVPERYLTHF